ncbi:LysR family transcriptional regulator [Aliamphritea spongicola]|nr:LysR family transcriptional regulator [Aliamphritea spongicola]
MAVKTPTIKQLEYFVCLAESTTFRSAAEQLKISQPTLTAQIYNLEKR